ESLLNLSRLVDEGEKYGIPVMAVTAVGKELGKRDARYLALACRIAAELGARLVKTYWCEEDFDRVVSGCPVPVVMAGGPQVDTELQVFEFVYDGLQKGAIGVNLGRNVWQNEHPVAMMRAMRALVHDKATPKQALDLFNTIKAGESRTGTVSLREVAEQAGVSQYKCRAMLLKIGLRDADHKWKRWRFDPEDVPGIVAKVKGNLKTRRRRRRAKKNKK
ncbi:MAG: hypothetical protein AB1793_09760, partial [Candidatus Thermoplasmatota archaeon]